MWYNFLDMVLLCYCKSGTFHGLFFLISCKKFYIGWEGYAFFYTIKCIGFVVMFRQVALSKDLQQDCCICGYRR